MSEKGESGAPNYWDTTHDGTVRVLKRGDFSEPEDASLAYANNSGLYIVFTHVVSGRHARFKAFITDFEDQYVSEWNDTHVYGRMDPVSTFQGTRRNISFSFDVIANSYEEALYNHEHSRRLVQFLYPMYDEHNIDDSLSATSITASPLIRIRFANLIAQGQGPLVGKLDGISYKPDFDLGVFHGDFDEDKSALLPKLNRFSCNYTVFHTEPLGYRINPHAPGFAPQLRDPSFPYPTSTGYRDVAYGTPNDANPNLPIEGIDTGADDVEADVNKTVERLLIEANEGRALAGDRLRQVSSWWY